MGFIIPNLKSVWLKGHSAPFLFKGINELEKPIFHGDFSNGYFNDNTALIESACEWDDISAVFLNDGCDFKVGDEVVYEYVHDTDDENISSAQGVITGFKFSFSNIKEIGAYVGAEVRMNGDSHSSNYKISLLKKCIT